MKNKIHEHYSEDLLNRIDHEGFDYCFVHYSDFKNIKDERFHKLRDAFVTARQKLADYIGFED